MQLHEEVLLWREGMLWRLPSMVAVLALVCTVLLTVHRRGKALLQKWRTQCIGLFVALHAVAFVNDWTFGANCLLMCMAFVCCFELFMCLYYYCFENMFDFASQFRLMYQLDPFCAVNRASRLGSRSSDSNLNVYTDDEIQAHFDAAEVDRSYALPPLEFWHSEYVDPSEDASVEFSNLARLSRLFEVESFVPHVYPQRHFEYVDPSENISVEFFNLARLSRLFDADPPSPPIYPQARRFFRRLHGMEEPVDDDDSGDDMPNLDEKTPSELDWDAEVQYRLDYAAEQRELELQDAHLEAKDVLNLSDDEYDSADESDDQQDALDRAIMNLCLHQRCGRNFPPPPFSNFGLWCGWA
jgi:hypothetical protein